MTFTIQIGAVTVRCRSCDSRYDLNGKLRVVEPGTDAMLSDVEHVVDRCPGCEPGDGGESVTAAE